MKNLELPKKYTNMVKCFIYEKGMYQISLNHNNVTAKQYYYEDTNKKNILKFLHTAIKQ